MDLETRCLLGGINGETPSTRRLWPSVGTRHLPCPLLDILLRAHWTSGRALLTMDARGKGAEGSDTEEVGAPPARGVVGADCSWGTGAPQRSRQDLGPSGVTGLAPGGHLHAVRIRSAAGTSQLCTADGHKITETNTINAITSGFPR